MHTTGASDVRRPRVLVIDDEKPIGRIIWKGISSSATVVYESEPKAGLDRLLDPDEEFDVTFLDVVMPDMNGITLFELLEELAPARVHRVVFITGGALIPAVREWFDRRPVHVVEKPFTLAELATIIQVYAALKLPRGPR